MAKKNGECYFRDEVGSLWLAESFVDDAGLTYSTSTLYEPPLPPENEAVV